MSALINLAEKWFTILSLFFFTDPIAVFEILGQEQSLVNRLQTVVRAAIALLTLLLIAAWREKVILGVIKEKLLWILIAVCVLSVLWSDSPSSTLRHNIYLIQTTLFAIYFSTRYSFSEQLRLLAWALGLGALLSLVFAVAFPDYGVMGMGNIRSSEDLIHIGAWRGAYTHKNPLGRIMVLASLVLLLVALSKRRNTWLAWAGFGFSLVLIQESNSKTALVMLLTLIALLPFYRALRWNYTLALPFFITAILSIGIGAMWFFENSETMAGMGVDLTLTGRTELWNVILDKIWQRPWLGYGYVGFWVGNEGQSAEVWNIVGWETPHSHNGFLDIWVDLGLLGLAIFVLSFLILYLRSICWVRLTQTSEGLFPISYLTFMLLSNLTESSLVEDNIFWVLYIAIALSMHNSSVNLEEENHAFAQHPVK